MSDFILYALFVITASVAEAVCGFESAVICILAYIATLITILETREQDND